MTQSVLLIKDMLCPAPCMVQGCGLLGYWQPGDWAGGGFFCGARGRGACLALRQ